MHDLVIHNGHRGARAAARRLGAALLMPLARQASRAYVAGERLEDALYVCQSLKKQGIGATLGFFDSEAQDTGRSVADMYLAGIRALKGTGDYLSIKLPALRMGHAPVVEESDILDFSRDLLGEVIRAARDAGVRIHFDAMWLRSAQPTREAVEQLLLAGECGVLGYTLPGRWRRSLEDADWAAAHRVNVRVVKGQWADPADPSRDLRSGFLEVIDRLAGRVPLVAVASHDVPMVRQAIARLRAAGTPCEMELLHGLPMRASLSLARELKVPVRVYVPFGKSHLPYAVAKVVSSPRLAWWLAKDLVMSL